MLGPIPLRAYALFIVAGIVLAWYLGERRYVRKGGPKDVSLDIAVWVVLFGIVGARLYHVITTPEPYFGPDGDPLQALQIWKGGLGIWGAVSVGTLGGWIALRRHNLRFAPFADAFAPGILLAQALGRMGNYFNQELFGGPTELPWGLEISPENMPSGYPVGTTFHPTFLYEMIWCVAAYFVLIWAEKRFELQGGQVMVGYVIAYTLGRVWIEMLRIDHAQLILGLRLNVWVSIFICVSAIVLLVWLRKRTPDNSHTTDVYLTTNKTIG